MLLYIHESKEISKQIEPTSEKKDSHKRIGFYAKVDIDVVSAIMSTVATYKGKPPVPEVQKAMLKAASSAVGNTSSRITTPTEVSTSRSWTPG